MADVFFADENQSPEQRLVAYLTTERDRAVVERDRALNNERRLSRAVGLLDFALGAACGLIRAACLEASNEEYLPAETFENIEATILENRKGALELIDEALPSADE